VEKSLREHICKPRGRGGTEERGKRKVWGFNNEKEYPFWENREGNVEKPFLKKYKKEGAQKIRGEEEGE